MQAGIACISPVTVQFRKQDHPRLVDLTKNAKRVVICNDAEDNGAGEKGALETARVLAKAARDVRIATLPRMEKQAKVDLNDFLRDHDPSELQALLRSAHSVADHLMAQVPDDTPAAEFDRRLTPVVAATLDLGLLERERVLAQIAQRFTLGREAVDAVLRRVQDQRQVEERKLRSIQLPEVFPEGVQESTMFEDANAALLHSNDLRIAQAARGVSQRVPPLFIRARQLIGLFHDHEGPYMSDLDEATVHGILARVANWVRMRKGNKEPARIPTRIAKDVLAFPPKELPSLESLVATPIFDRNGKLLKDPGLHVTEQLWLHADPRLGEVLVPNTPTAEDIVAARELIVEHLFYDFPFQEASDRAHAIAALALPFMRRIISDDTPMHVVSAPTAGSGKTLLCNLISIVATGKECDSHSLPDNDEEARKMLTAEFATGRGIILLDNVKNQKMLDSTTLANAITARSWTDRKLGENAMLTSRPDATWFMTANNPRFSMELARRCIRIRLDSKRDMPWMRTGFKHKPIRRWAVENRNALVTAVLTLIQAWVVQGMPHKEAEHGSFGVWAPVFAGAMEVWEIPGFLENTQDFYETSDEEGTSWREFTAAWWQRFGDQAIRVNELNAFCEERNLLEEIRLREGGKYGDTPRAQQTRLGRALVQVRGCVYGDLRIVLVADRGHKGKAYALRPVDTDYTDNVVPFDQDAAKHSEDGVDPWA